VAKKKDNKYKDAERDKASEHPGEFGDELAEPPP